VPAGQSSATFTVTTKPVAAQTTVTVRAASPGPTRYAQLTLTPSLALGGITVTPSNVKGGGSVTGTVTMTAPVLSDTTISLVSGNAAATMPPSVVIRRGSRSASFTVKTSRVKVQQVAILSASYGGVTQTTKLNINP